MPAQSAGRKFFDVPPTFLCAPHSARALGVVLDSRLTMSTHVGSVYRSAYYQLRKLRPVMRSLSLDAAKMLAQAFISSRPDYRRSLAGPITWNSLPIKLRLPDLSLEQFRRLLKTHLFS